MAYSTSIKAVQRYKKFLDHLLQAKGATIVFKARNPSKLAYALRQAFALSERWQNEYKDLRAKFTVKASTDCVICIVRTRQEDFFEVLRESGIPLLNVTRVEEVVGACLEYPQKVLQFPNYNPSDSDLAVLYNWGKETGVTFTLEDNRLTARPYA